MTSTDLATALAAFKTLLNGVTSASPGGTAARIRSVLWSQGSPTERGLPFLALQVLSIRRAGMVDGDHEWIVRIKLRVLFLVSRISSAHNDSLRYANQIDNLIDGWLPQGGVEGGEGVEWAMSLPNEPSQGNIGLIEGEVAIRVRTDRGDN